MISVVFRVLPAENPIGKPTILRWNFRTQTEANAFSEGFREGQGWVIASETKKKDHLQLSLLED